MSWRVFLGQMILYQNIQSIQKKQILWVVLESSVKTEADLWKLYWNVQFMQKQISLPVVLGDLLRSKWFFIKIFNQYRSRSLQVVLESSVNTEADFCMLFWNDQVIQNQISVIVLLKCIFKIKWFFIRMFSWYTS